MAKKSKSKKQKKAKIEKKEVVKIQNEKKLNKNINIIDSSGGFVKLVETITNRNKKRSYPDINDIPNQL